MLTNVIASPSPTAHGAVRVWHDDEGWGVVDVPDLASGCWVHYSVVLVPGHRTLVPGEHVAVRWESVEQDGFCYRATAVWPVGAGPNPITPETATGAYASTLSISTRPRPET